MSSKSSKSKASTASKSHYPSSRASSRAKTSIGGSTHLSAQEAIIQAAVKKAELKCQLEALTQKHRLEKEEGELQMKVKGINREKEKLKVEVALHVEEAKLEVLQGSSIEGGSCDDNDGVLIPPPAPFEYRDKMSAVEGWLNKEGEQSQYMRDPSELPVGDVTLCSTPQVPTESHGQQSMANQVNVVRTEHDVIQLSPAPLRSPDSNHKPKHEVSSVSERSGYVDPTPNQQRQQPLQTKEKSSGDDLCLTTPQTGLVGHMVQQSQVQQRNQGCHCNTCACTQQQYVLQEPENREKYANGANMGTFDHHEIKPAPHGQNTSWNRNDRSEIKSWIPLPVPGYDRVQCGTTQGVCRSEPKLDVNKIVPSQHRYHSDRDTMPHVQQQQAQKQVTDLATLLIEQQGRITLPKRDIKAYNGDPLQFTSFMNAFKHGIEQRTMDDKERLYYLEELTTGEPNRLVKSFLNREKGYEEAKALLKKKFGNRFIIATAFRKQAETWPIVKRDDEQAWTKFSIFLIEYQNTMMDMKHIDEIDHSATIKLLLSKLPYTIRNQWRIQVDKLMENQDKCPGFQDFVTFIERQTRIVCNPVYGNIEDPSKPKDRQQQQRSQKFRARSSFATTTTQGSGSEKTRSETWCSFCESSTHTLDVCRKLSQKPHKDRIEFLKSKGMCFGCLRKASHMCKDCKTKLKCNTCSGKHPTVLHIERMKYGQESSTQRNDSTTKKEVPKAESGKGTAEKATSCRLTGAGFASSIQSIVPVIVRSRITGESVKTNAMLDDGSDAVFCTEGLRTKLGVGGTKTRLHVNTIAGDEVMETKRLTGLEIVSTDGENVIELPGVYTRSAIPADVTHYPVTEDLKQWPYLHEIDLPEIEGEVDLLIGRNVPKALEPWRVIHSTDGGPFACKTLLGWTVHGLTKDTDCNVSVNRIMVTDREINKQLQEMYNADFSEKLIEDELQSSREDELFMKMVKGSMKYKDGHYEIGLPIKEENCSFPNNRHSAEQRLAHLQRKFLRSGEEYRSEYTSFIEDMLAKGYAEKVPEPEIECSSNRVWYIPHHSVYHPQKGKIRVVFDCAATYHGVSLNDRLLQGPDLTNSLVGVILRFRQAPVAMMADIKSMFHQVRVPPSDRDLLRFLWWPSGDTTKPIQEYRMKSHIFGARSSPSCANFALRQTALDSQEGFDSDVASTLHHNFYVDDCLRSVASEDQAVHLASGLQAACSNGGFHLTKWISNSRKVIGSIPEEDRASGVKALDFQDTLPMERALGVLWCPETDAFRFHVQVKDKPATRRGILSIVSSIYDPLGFVAPVILPSKRILQDLCRMQLSWDEEVPEMYRLQWDQWLKKIPAISSFTIPRCYVPSNFGTPCEVQLHHFSDASELGYGVVSYLRFTNEHGDTHCTLVSSKSRVAPLKQVTIPRLELTAATVAVKVNYQLHKELDISIDNTYFWSDSTTTLQYIQSETKRFKTFVANRLAIIRDGSKPSQWRYVNTSMNPADECSRGLTVEKFLQDERWLQGPPFLWKPESMWPEPMPLKTPNEDDPELKQVAVHTLHVNECHDAIDRLLEYHSSWYSLRRAVAWILKVKQTLLSRINQRRQVNQTNQTNKTNVNQIGIEQPEVSQSKDEGSNVLSHRDLLEAEKSIIQYIQRTSFANEIAALEGNHGNELTSGKQHVAKSSPIHRLNPQVVDGVLRVGGRLSKAAMPEEAKHPCILPKNCHVTYLILQEIHQSKGHVGRNYMLAQFRQKFWAASANAMCRYIICKCVVCRKQYRKAESQRMADLPPDRVLPDDPPFTKVGVDYFGPFQVIVGRSRVKRYGVIFTCLTTRAVHLEVADSLNTDSCINAIRRFVARRGQVDELRSDNGTNLVGAERELLAEIKRWNQSKIHDACLQKGITWIFNPPAGSNFGGVWERQVRTIRKVLNSVIREQILTDEGLSTLMCEVEAIVNGRPLTRTSEDPCDIEALTPNHLLLMKGKPALPPAISTAKDQYLRRRWKQIQYLADLFWRRWVKEYLPQLQERQKWGKIMPNVKEGDVVLVMDNSQPRGSWPMAKVEQTMPDSQGQVRVVKVKTKAGTFIRPVNKLITLLECDTAPINKPVISVSEVNSGPAQPKRQQVKKNTFPKTPDLVHTRAGRLVKPKKCLDL